MNRQHPRVLIVEDDQTIAHILAKLFESWFWETRKAFTVSMARDLLSVPLDLIVLDLMLPDGGGVEILREARGRKLDVPIVVATARNLDSIQEVIELSPDQLLFKPFVFEPLKELAASIYAAFRPTAARLAE